MGSVMDNNNCEIKENLEIKDDDKAFRDTVESVLVSEYRIAKTELDYETFYTKSFIDRQIVEEKVFLLERLMEKVGIKIPRT